MTVVDRQQLLQGFDCVARADARVLILGSMPGHASLQQSQYYAHPRNSFWYIMGELFGAGPELNYERRLQVLMEQQIALWDVVHRCHRKGSLDADIEAHSVEPNDFQMLFARCPDIHHVYFNGQTAAGLFNRQVLTGLPTELLSRLGMHYHTLPSTSPAHAGLDREQKLQQWQCVRDYLDKGK